MLAALLRSLETADTSADRSAAIALGVEGADEAVARFVAHRAHLVLRGGARTLLREALSEPEGSAVRRLADAFVALHGTLGVRLVRRSSTASRPEDEGRVRTLPGADRVGEARISPDGEWILAFVHGLPEWGDEAAPGGSRVAIWRAATGELVQDIEVGQFSYEHGSMALSPDGRTLAVRRYRDIDVFDLDGGRVGHRRHRLPGAEGPYAMRFVDPTRLVADDASVAHRVWDVRTGERIAAGNPVGWRALAIARSSACLWVGGSQLRRPGRLLGASRLPGLEPDGVWVAPTDRCVYAQAIDVSPSEVWVATGGDDGEIWAWRVAELADRTGTLEAPVVVAGARIGHHAGPVSAIRFLDDDRLISGGDDGVVACWELARPGTPARTLRGHRGRISSLDVHPTRRWALSGGEDGDVLVWDLERAGSSNPGVLPAAKRSRELRKHSDGVEVRADDGPWQRVPLGVVGRGEPLPQDPDLIGYTLRGHDVVITNPPDPPQLRVVRDGAVVDVVELERQGGGCALDERTLAHSQGAHLDVWQLLEIAER
jgi:WD40 repeat protein